MKMIMMFDYTLMMMVIIVLLIMMLMMEVKTYLSPDWLLLISARKV